MKKRFALLAAFVCLCVTALCLFASCSGDSTKGVKYSVSLDKSHAIVIGYDGDEADVVIASTYKNLPVQVIATNAFRGTDVQKITIPDSVVSIETYAFSDCTSLKSITLGSGLKEIEDKAFVDCYRLVEVVNRSKNFIVSAGSDDNGGVGSFALSVFNGDAQYVDRFINESGLIFYKNGADKILVDYNGDDTSLEIPAGCTEIYYGTFRENKSIESVIIPDGVTSVGDWAFSGCTSLKDVSIANSVDYVGKRAFSSCRSLSDINLPEGLNSIEEYLFYNCENLENITIPESVTSVGKWAFACNKINEIVIPDNVTTIEERAFSQCHDLKKVTLCAGINLPDQSAFYECNSLTDLYYNGTLVDWCAKVFMGTDKVNRNPLYYTSVTDFYIDGVLVRDLVIPDEFTEISPYAFRGYDGLTSVTLPAGAVLVPEGAFEGCSNFDTLRYNGTLTEWLGKTFEKAANNPLSYGIKEFYIAGELVKDVVIPDEFTEINAYAFNGYYGLETVVLSKNIKTIGEDAFKGCDGLIAAYYKGTKSEWSKLGTSTGIPDKVTYFYSEEEPPVNSDGTAYEGNYWHYNEGKPVIWTKCDQDEETK